MSARQVNTSLSHEGKRKSLELLIKEALPAFQ